MKAQYCLPSSRKQKKSLEAGFWHIANFLSIKLVHLRRLKCGLVLYFRILYDFSIHYGVKVDDNSSDKVSGSKAIMNSRCLLYLRNSSVTIKCFKIQRLWAEVINEYLSAKICCNWSSCEFAKRATCEFFSALFCLLYGSGPKRSMPIFIE